MVEFFGLFIPSTYLGGGIGVIVLIIILIWFMKNRGSGRIGTENQKLQQDEELFDLDKDARKTEKYERKEADELIGYYKRLKDNAFSSRSLQKIWQINSIIGALKKIKNENVNVPQAINLLKQIREQKTTLLTDLPLSEYDKEDLLPKITAAENNLYNALLKEYKDLRKEYGILKQEEEETRKELAA